MHLNMETNISYQFHVVFVFVKFYDILRHKTWKYAIS